MAIILLTCCLFNKRVHLLIAMHSFLIVDVGFFLIVVGPTKLINERHGVSIIE